MASPTPFTGSGDFSNYTLVSNAPDAVTPSDNGAKDTVRSGWERSLEYSDAALRVAIQFIDKLSKVRFATIGVDPNLARLDLDIARFDALLGTIPVNPNHTFAFTEIPYSSNLLTDLRARLLEWVDGKSTGLLPSVEQAIWDRGRAREVVSSNRKAQEAVRQFAMRGFSKPPGALSLEIMDATQESQNASLTLSREVMIKQAELEQSNRRFSFEQAEKMEEALIAYTSQQAARALEAAKALQTFLIDIYGHEVQAYGVETQAYAARVGAETAVFKAKTDTNVAEANVRIEAARIQIQTYIQEVTLLVESMKAGATVSAQLAASAMSAVNISAGLSSSVSESASNSSSRSSQASVHEQIGLNAQYSYTPAI